MKCKKRKNIILNQVKFMLRDWTEIIRVIVTMVP